MGTYYAGIAHISLHAEMTASCLVHWKMKGIMRKRNSGWVRTNRAPLSSWHAEMTAWSTLERNAHQYAEHANIPFSVREIEQRLNSAYVWLTYTTVKSDGEVVMRTRKPLLSPMHAEVNDSISSKASSVSTLLEKLHTTALQRNLRQQGPQFTKSTKQRLRFRTMPAFSHRIARQHVREISDENAPASKESSRSCARTASERKTFKKRPRVSPLLTLQQKASLMKC